MQPDDKIIPINIESEMKSAYIDFYQVEGGSDTITLQEKVALTGGKVPTTDDLGIFKNNISFTRF